MPTASFDNVDLRRFGAALKAAGPGMRKDVAKAMQRATKPAKAEIKRSAIAVLPSSGGLNQWAASVTVRTRASFVGRNVGVTITGSKARKRKRRGGRVFGAGADLSALNRGRVMHPSWGHGPLKGPQMVPAGFWDKAIQGPIMNQVEKEVTEALEGFVRELAARAGTRG